MILRALISAAPILLRLVLPLPVQAQVYSPPPSPGVSSFDLQAAIASATPPGCGTPSADTLLGSAGTFGNGCMPNADASRPTAVQRTNTTLNADCTWSVTFSRAFTSSTPTVHAEPVLSPSATQPMQCSPTARSTTTQSGKCFLSQATNLAAVTVVGVSVAVGAQAVNPTAATCPAGAVVQVIAAEPTQ